ncbi:hypothetical protein TUMSATVNIG3_01900 [Vibrio nigripulchritudo]|nr:hypothetical protein TUMSATVNIG2_01910 [Vibrio nigripulchritudo]BDU41392.1 hypothetical protein TUMSATVNIG3_01900 [Vibrio nigripulchritudo]
MHTIGKEKANKILGDPAIRGTVEHEKPKRVGKGGLLSQFHLKLKEKSLGEFSSLFNIHFLNFERHRINHLPE